MSKNFIGIKYHSSLRVDRRKIILSRFSDESLFLSLVIIRDTSLKSRSQDEEDRGVVHMRHEKRDKEENLVRC